MRTLIVYAGKTGTTRACAEELALRVKDAVCCDLNRENPSPEGYDAVVLGGSVRMGLIHAKARAYVKRYAPVLAGKKLALFVCSCDITKKRVQEYLAQAYPAALVKQAIFADSLGGELDMNKQKGLDRLVVKMIQKSPDGGMSVPGIRQSRVEALAALLKEGDPA